MKKGAIFFCLGVLTTACSLCQPSDFPKLSGPYLGQKPPGMMPEVFAPGIVSTTEYREFSGTFAPDGHEYYFFRFAEGAGIMVSKLRDGGWTAPQPADFNTAFIDNEPHITPDGRYMFFCSNRPFPGNQDKRIPTQVWFMARNGDSWGEPKRLGMGMFATTSKKGNIYIGSTVYRLVNDELVEMEKLEYDSSVLQGNRLPRHHTFIASDESYHVFDYQEVLYVSFRKPNGAWGRPIDLSEKLNLPGGKMLPTISPDNQHLFFCHKGDIYWVSASVIEDMRLKENDGPKD